MCLYFLSQFGSGHSIVGGEFGAPDSRLVGVVTVVVVVVVIAVGATVIDVVVVIVIVDVEIKGIVRLDTDPAIAIEADIGNDEEVDDAIEFDVLLPML